MELYINSSETVHSDLIKPSYTVTRVVLDELLKCGTSQ